MIPWGATEDRPVCELCGTETRHKDRHGTIMCEECDE